VSSDSELEKLNENELKSAIKHSWKKHERLAKKDMGPLLY
jgi:lambda repressor-like predicted transcriptional regulator